MLLRKGMNLSESGAADSASAFTNALRVSYLVLGKRRGLTATVIKRSVGVIGFRRRCRSQE